MTNIEKICKKHGRLEDKDTYLMKTKYGSLIKMCSICKKGYRNNWAKLNPEKVKIAHQKMKQKRLKELSSGELKKTCKKHGELPISKIRVDARGTRVCRLCSNEDKIKSKARVDPTGERYRKWLYSDRERVNRYRANDKPKRRKRQLKAYYKLKEENPVKYKEKELQKLACARKAHERLDDQYVASMLRTIRTGGRKNRFYHYLKGAKISKELIEIVKLQIKLKRKIKEKKNVRDKDHDGIKN